MSPPDLCPTRQQLLTCSAHPAPSSLSVAAMACRGRRSARATCCPAPMMHRSACGMSRAPHRATGCVWLVQGGAGQGRACRVAWAATAAGLQKLQLVLLVFSLPCALISQAPSLPRCRSNWRRCTSSRAIWGWWRMWRGTRGTQTCLAAWATTRSWWVHEHVKGWLLEALRRTLDCTAGWLFSLCP